MSFRQKVAAIKREHRKREKLVAGIFTLDDYSHMILRPTVASMIPRLVNDITTVPVLIKMFERETAGGVWRDDELAPHEIAERSRQYSVLRELEGAR